MKKDDDTQASLDEAVNRYVKSLRGFIFGKKGVMLLVLMFFGIVAIVSISTEKNGGSRIQQNDIEKKLATIISNIEGVESADVMITYESTSRKVPATQGALTTITGENTEGTTKFLQGTMGNTLIVTELEPEIRGVVVVAKGADDYMVKIDIIDAVKTVLNVSSDKVEVLNMK